MTREEAIKEIQDASDHEVRHGDIEHHYEDIMRRVEAFEKAVNALQKEPIDESMIGELQDSIQKANATNSTLIKLIENYRERPSVTPYKGWISVEEDTPPEGTICLWCNKQGSVFVSAITLRMEKYSYVGQHGWFSNGLENHGNIVAWMPLPEPYGEREGKE